MPRNLPCDTLAQVTPTPVSRSSHLNLQQIRIEAVGAELDLAGILVGLSNISFLNRDEQAATRSLGEALDALERAGRELGAVDSVENRSSLLTKIEGIQTAIHSFRGER